MQPQKIPPGSFQRASKANSSKSSVRQRNCGNVLTTSKQRPFPTASVTESNTCKDRKSQSETGIAEDRERTTPLKRGSAFTFRLVVERYVSNDWTRRRVREKQCRRKLETPTPHFIGEMRNSWQRFSLLISGAVCNLSMGQSNSNFQSARFRAGADY